MALRTVREVSGRRYLELVNPANGEKIFNPITGQRGECIEISNEAEVLAAVSGAREAHNFWSSLSQKERGRYFQALKHTIVKHSDVITRLISEENGKNTAECWEELLVVLGLLQAYRGKGLANVKVFRGSALNIFKKIITNTDLNLRAKQYGVVGLITPWNYPFMIPFNIITRSLFYGNSVVLKPSEQTPLGGEIIRYVAEKAWEISGFNRRCRFCPIAVVQGDGEVGKFLSALLNEEKINFLFFCGSSGAGRKVKDFANDKSKLELLLGGKDAFVVFEDCDLKTTVNALVGGCLFNTGQSCSSVERVYAAKSISEQLIAAILQEVRKMKVGYAYEDCYDLGPLMNRQQFELVMDHLDDAVAKGAKILFGGKRLTGGIFDKGYYLEPTVLVNVNHGMKIMTEETFGPMIPIMVAETEEKLIRLANDCKFGLTDSVWTRNIAEGESAARKLEAGTVYVNDIFWTASEPKVHWPGAKESGNCIDEEAASQDKVIAITRGNFVDKISQFWLGKNTPAKIRLFKILVKLGYRF